MSYFSPTLNFHNSEEGLQYAVSIDNEKPQIFSLNKDENARGVWDRWAANNIIFKSSYYYSPSSISYTHFVSPSFHY